ncbi:TcfC E-set like domain-containing protein [Vagococcus sp. WN89Y]|uniref:TcfC E-set like domain-containing protein n=1 Tax=Vagococcus sp. WN89Y TaxID=3457258 RepID=UPI003FCC6EE3
MKISLAFLAAFPFIVSANDIQLAANMRGIPEDFRRYFYNSAIVVQVFLNDNYIFDASVSLKENGEVKLLHILEQADNADSDLLARWSDILNDGVSIGECISACPSGLMHVEYHLNSSALKLYTSAYETSQVASDYLPVPDDAPAGLIMFNDVSVSDAASTRSWGINSSMTSSLGGWSQQASFQSSGTRGEYRYSSSSLYEFFTQKELQGDFIRIGLFSPDNATGNVQTSGFGYDTVAGVMWGTSDALLVNTDSVSAWPVYVTGRNQSIAEVWRDGRLIRTQQLQPGIQALDTRQLPIGIYDITVKIIENGQTVDTQQAQIFKTQGWSNPNKRWRMNLWGGQRRTIASKNVGSANDNPDTAGGGIEVLVHPRAVVGLSGAVTEKEQRLRSRANITLTQKDRIFAQYTFGNTEYMGNQDTDIRYYRSLYTGGSASLFWRSTVTDVYGRRVRSGQTGKTWGVSLSSRLPLSSSLILNAQYVDTVWRKGTAVDASLSTQASFYGRDTNFRMSAYDRPGFDSHRRDYGIAFSVSVALASSAQHTVAFDTGFDQEQGYSSLNYQWQPQESPYIRYLGAGVSYNASDTVLNGNGALNTPWISGDFYTQRGIHSGNNTLGGNLTQVLVMGGGKVASVNGNNSRSMESAVIVDVDVDDKDTQILASSNTRESRLQPGRNIIPVDLWKRSAIQFSARGDESVQVSPERQTIQMRRGSVQYVQVKTVKTFTLVSMLLDGQGNPIKNRRVKSDVTSSMVNAEGVLTLDSGVMNRQLVVLAEKHLPALQCGLPATMEPNKKVQFISAVRCRIANTEEK